MRSSIAVVVVGLGVVGIVILLGFLTNQEYSKVPEIAEQIEKLEIYKIELEKIHQSNLQILENLEDQIKNSDDIHLQQINDEIEVIKQVLDENKQELEQVIYRLSQMELTP